MKVKFVSMIPFHIRLFMPWTGSNNSLDNRNQFKTMLEKKISIESTINLFVKETYLPN